MKNMTGTQIASTTVLFALGIVGIYYIFKKSSRKPSRDSSFNSKTSIPSSPITSIEKENSQQETGKYVDTPRPSFNPADKQHNTQAHGSNMVEPGLPRHGSVSSTESEEKDHVDSKHKETMDIEIKNEKKEEEEEQQQQQQKEEDLKQDEKETVGVASTSQYSTEPSTQHDQEEKAKDKDTIEEYDYDDKKTYDENEPNEQEHDPQDLEPGNKDMEKDEREEADQIHQYSKQLNINDDDINDMKDNDNDNSYNNNNDDDHNGNTNNNNERGSDKQFRFGSESTNIDETEEEEALASSTTSVDYQMVDKAALDDSMEMSSSFEKVEPQEGKRN